MTEKREDRTEFTLPRTTNPMVLRTDFSDESAWQSLCRAIEEPQTEDDFRAIVEFISDPRFDGVTIGQLLAVDHNSCDRRFMFVADHNALTGTEHPILVIDLDQEYGEFGRTFRVIPSEMWSVENKLSLANMDFSEFADNTVCSGVSSRCFRASPNRLKTDVFCHEWGRGNQPQASSVCERRLGYRSTIRRFCPVRATEGAAR